jgi:hypothetical protein
LSQNVCTGYQGASRLQDGKARATHVDDERLKVIAGRVDLQGMDILDVGCNTGYVTVQAGKNFKQAKSHYFGPLITSAT